MTAEAADRVETAGVARRSGLRDPAAAARGVGAVALGAMVLVLVLAIAPMVRLVGVGPEVWLVLALAAVGVADIGMLRRRWAWWAAGVVPSGLFAGGLLMHWSLAVLGVVFGLLWGYVLMVRRTVTSGVPRG